MTRKRTKRVLILANKGFEADPLVHVLLSQRGPPREHDLGAVSCQSYPRLRKTEQRKREELTIATQPLMTIALPRAGQVFASVEVWCVEDLLLPEDSSSTLEKAKALGHIASKAPAPDFVIAFGTGGAFEPRRFNGSVVIGSKVFIHDPYRDGPRDGMWTPPEPDVVIESPMVPSKFFRELDEDSRYPAEGRFLLPPIRPARPPRIVAGHAFVSIGVVNVNKRYDDFAWADREAMARFRATTAGKLRIGSVETTHGVIRSSFSASAFIHVTGISNVTGGFDVETTPRVYGQNFVAAHNAAIALAWLLPQLAEVL